MKILKFLFLIATIAILGSCSKKVEYKDIVEMNGKLYYANDTSKLVTDKIIDYYPDGTKKFIADISGGVLSGEYECFWENGNTQLKLVFHNDAITKIEEALNSDGSKYCDCNIVEKNDESGKWENLNDNKLMDGLCISLYDNGLPLEIKIFQNGAIRQEWKFYENGNQKQLKLWSAKQNMSLNKGWFESGNIYWDNHWNIEGNLEIAQQWYDNGQKQFEHNMNEKKKDAANSLKGWYEDGSVAYKFIAKEANPMTYHPFVDIFVFDDVIEYSEYIDNAEGKAYNNDGSVATETFYEGEKNIRIKNDTRSISAVAWDRDGKYIERIEFYGGYDLVIFGQNKTIEEACQWYGKRYGYSVELLK